LKRKIRTHIYKKKLFLVICSDNKCSGDDVQRWGGKQSMQLNIIKITITNFGIKEVLVGRHNTKESGSFYAGFQFLEHLVRVVKSRLRCVGGCVSAVVNGFRTHSVFTEYRPATILEQLEDAERSFPLKPQNMFKPYMSIEGVHSRE
jgi:hypothetical protein